MLILSSSNILPNTDLFLSQVFLHLHLFATAFGNLGYRQNIKKQNPDFGLPNKRNNLCFQLNHFPIFVAVPYILSCLSGCYTAAHSITMWQRHFGEEISLALLKIIINVFFQMLLLLMLNPAQAPALQQAGIPL